MRLENVKHVGVVGGGIMGAGIAQVLAAAGYRVTIRDITDQVIDDTRDALVEGKWGVKRAVEHGKMGFDTASQVIDLVGYTTNVADLSDCDVIIEAVPEKLELKQEVFKELDIVVKDDAIFTSNTSGLVIQEIASAVSEQRQKQFLGMHFSNPVPVMSMCEVITTPQSSDDAIEAIVGIAKASKRAVSMVKDMPGTYGFILNRVFAAAAREGRKIVEDGIATEEDVDKAMITGRNWPAAFFGNRGGIGKEW
ncbi:MAG: 3-hydroxyacyl-CoA dehydrogenase family protein [bacterium]|nr:3-hydroxyacyl-CoA dehydrogenase family protein [Gammaproteobacteria bacterium]HIL95835.1 3-hydroxyacyl-CoA dehydrogenase family protein [Pseudomonadales bacterium]